MKKLFKSALPFLALLTVICFLASCATQISTISITEYVLKSKTEQSKGGLTVELEVLNPTLECMHKHPELFAFDSNKLHSKIKSNSNIWYKPASDGKRYCYTFGIQDYTLTSALVKITNNTNHILRMKDARVYLRLADEDPVRAVNKLGEYRLEVIDQKGNVLPKSSITGDESLVHWVTYLENYYESSRKKGLISIGYPVGLASQVIAQNIRKYKLITDVDTEILPGDAYEGILLFPAILSGDKYKKANIKFYDMTTKTDAAGNAIEKVTFDFEFDIITTHKWWDSNQKKWIDGEPPTGA